MTRHIFLPTITHDAHTARLPSNIYGSKRWRTAAKWEGEGRSLFPFLVVVLIVGHNDGRLYIVPPSALILLLRPHRQKIYCTQGFPHGSCSRPDSELTKDAQDGTASADRRECPTTSTTTPAEGNKSFVAFSNLNDAESLTQTWKVPIPISIP